MQLSFSFIVMLAFIINAWGSALFAQEESIVHNTPVYKIYLKDGSLLIGTIISENDTTIQFITLSEAEVKIPAGSVERREQVSEDIAVKSATTGDPNRTRLLFSPTGRALKQGQGYFSVYEIFFPFVAVGVTDWLSLAGGLTLVPGAEEQAVYVSSKITPLQLERFDVSAGALYINIPDEEEDGGIFYGVGTYGTESAALTAGLGWGFSGSDVSNKPVIVLGGEARLSNSIKFITENWIIPDSEVDLVSGGIRFFGENLAADFALIYATNSDIEGFPFLPWIGFAYNFGGK